MVAGNSGSGIDTRYQTGMGAKTMAKMKAPCKDCADRKEACHDTCERYKAYKDKQNEFLLARFQVKQMDGLMISLAKRRRSKRK